MRKSFQTFFPGAQWVGDGMQVAIEVNGERFVFNLELNVDAHAGALVGAHLGPTEDSEAVTEAFDDGVSATGEPPLALLLDNRESNHTDVVEAALGDQTLLIRSSPGRPQNKGHVEGAFGLFQQSAPPLVIEAQTERELAEAVLWLVTIVWGRTLNHKPRDDRKGRSRVDIYREEKPTQEQIDAAKKALESRRRKQEKAYKTRRARMNPVAREILDNAFSRLEFDDPDGNIKSAIARYPVDVIVSAIAIFEAKRNARTLPENAGPRYLLGIARNTAQRIEDRNLTDTLIRLRTETRDITLAPLIKETQQILQDHTAWIVRSVLLPEFGPVVMSAITPDNIERFIGKLRKRTSRSTVATYFKCFLASCGNPSAAGGSPVPIRLIDSIKNQPRAPAATSP